jgi:hypothetical protein
MAPKEVKTEMSFVLCGHGLRGTGLVVAGHSGGGSATGPRVLGHVIGSASGVWKWGSGGTTGLVDAYGVL